MADEVKKVHKVKYFAAWAQWIVEFIGNIISYFSDHPVPKKADYEG